MVERERDVTAVNSPRGDATVAHEEHCARRPRGGPRAHGAEEDLPAAGRVEFRGSARGSGHESRNRRECRSDQETACRIQTFGSQ